LSGVLEGVRVLDFGRYIAGPFCAALLGDLGAEVIRIERLAGGEDRPFIPVGAGPEGGGAMFLAICRPRYCASWPSISKACGAPSRTSS